VEEEVKPQSVKAVTFLKSWPTYPVLTAIFVGPDGAKGRIETKAFPPGPEGVDWRAVFQWVDARNGKANLYFLVNPLREPKDNKADRTDLSGLVALHVDVDVRVGEKQAEGIERIVKTFHAYKVPPSLITSSGGGAQAFWLLDQPLALDGTLEAAESAKLYNVAIERDLDGDHCHNIDRIMRLPGTVNIPNAVKLKKGRVPALAQVLEFDPARRYPLASFDKADAVKPKSPAASTPSAPGTAKEKTKRGAKEGTDVFYEGVPTVNDETPILTIEDDRLKFVDPVVKHIILDGKAPPEAPPEVRDMTRGTLDMKCVAELVRCGFSDRSIKQIYKLGKISADADQWPRGFDGDMDRLIERARELKRDPDLERMNANYAVIAIGGKVRILTWAESEVFPGQFEPVPMSIEDFTFFHRREKKITYVKERDESGNETGALKKKTTSLVTYWLNHPQCRQFEGIRFMPHHDAPAKGVFLNLWRGWSVTPKTGDWSLFKAHIHDNLCSGNDEYYQYLLKWMAFIVQKRERSDVIVLLRSSEEGTGKTFFAHHFGKIFGPAFMSVTNSEHVVGKFNHHLQSLLLINPEEALFAGDPRHRNALWSLTTAETITVEPKGLGIYVAKNYLNFIMTTNNEKALEVTSTARRVFALEVLPKQRVNYAYFEAIADQLKAGGYEAMLHELQTMDLTGFNVRDCPKTETLAQQISLSRKGVDALVEKVCSEARVPCAHYKEPGLTITTSNDRFDGFDNLIDRSLDRELSKLRSLAVKRILCKEWGCISGDSAQRRVKGGDRDKYGTDRIAGLKWPDLPVLRGKFEERHGKQEWLVPDATDYITSEAPIPHVGAAKPDTSRLDGIM
jgi:hypothetical protein